MIREKIFSQRSSLVRNMLWEAWDRSDGVHLLPLLVVQLDL